MKSFDDILLGAKNHNGDDMISLLSYYANYMKKVCAKHKRRNDEDMQAHLIMWFVEDTYRFHTSKEDRIKHFLKKD